MLKRIFCIVLSLVTVFSCCGLSCVYGGITEEKVTTDAYKWTLYTDEIKFQEALLSSGINEGITAKNVKINDLTGYQTSSDEEQAYQGYGKVLFVAEYTNKDGNTDYAYLSGSDMETGISAQNRSTLGQKLKSAYSLDGFQPGADEFYTKSDPGVPWVKTMYTLADKKQDTKGWTGNRYAIRMGDGTSTPGKYFLSTLENIYASDSQWGSKQYYSDFWEGTCDNYVVGNGLSYKYKNASGVYGRSDIFRHEYWKDKGDLRGETQTDYFYIFFGGNGNSGTQQAKIGSKKAVIKTFNDGKFVRDPQNEKNVDWGAIYDNKTKNFIGYSRSWSVTENNGSPVLFSSIYFDDNDQFRIADALTKLRNSDIFHKMFSMTEYYIDSGDITEEILKSMSDDHLFDYAGRTGNAILGYVKEWKMSMIVHDETYEYFREQPGYVSSLGTDKDKGATMTGFYVYVGEKCKLTTINTKETVDNGQTKIMSSREQISAGSSITVNEGGTLIIEGNVFCYGSIYINGGTLIVKGQLLNTYPGNHIRLPSGDSTFERKNRAEIYARNGTIIVLDDALINLELCYSDIILSNQSSMYIYGMVCNNGSDMIYDSNFVLGNEGVYIHSGTLRTGENYQKYTRGGLNKMQSSASASKTLYSNFIYNTTPRGVSIDRTFVLSRSSCDIKGDLIMWEKCSSSDNLTTDIKQYYKSIIQ